jgi:hypothetical protein
MERLKELEQQMGPATFLQQVPVDASMVRNQMAEATDLAGEAQAMLNRQLILTGLKFLGNDTRMGEVHEAADETFGWILEVAAENSLGDSNNVTFAQWMRSGLGVFHITGKPGSGKSTLMKYIVDHPRTPMLLSDWSGAKKLVISKFFLWRFGNREQKSFRGLTQGLLYAAVRSAPELIEFLFPQYWDPAGVISKSARMRVKFDITERDVTTAFNRLVGGTVPEIIDRFRICFFIDGLDEFDEHQGVSFLELRRQILHWSSRLPETLKICVSSRLWPVFEGMASSEFHKMSLHDLTRNDISKLVTNTLNNHENFQKLQITDPVGCQRLIDEVVNDAEGVFLWVTLILRSLEDGLSNNDPLSLLQSRVATTPQQLNAFFKTILDSIDPQHRQSAYYLFALVMCMAGSLLSSPNGSSDLLAQTPNLHPRELPAIPYVSLLGTSFLFWALDGKQRMDAATCWPEEKLSDSREEMRERLKVTEVQIRGRCKGLLDVDEMNSVKFIHRTIPEYLQEYLGARLHEYGMSDERVGQILVWMLLAEVKYLGIYDLDAMWEGGARPKKKVALKKIEEAVPSIRKDEGEDKDGCNLGNNTPGERELNPIRDFFGGQDFLADLEGSLPNPFRPLSTLSSRGAVVGEGTSVRSYSPSRSTSASNGSLPSTDRGEHEPETHEADSAIEFASTSRHPILGCSLPLTDQHVQYLNGVPTLLRNEFPSISYSDDDVGEGRSKYSLTASEFREAILWASAGAYHIPALSRLILVAEEPIHDANLISDYRKRRARIHMSEYTNLNEGTPSPQPSATNPWPRNCTPTMTRFGYIMSRLRQADLLNQEATFSILDALETETSLAQWSSSEPPDYLWAMVREPYYQEFLRRGPSHIAIYPRYAFGVLGIASFLGLHEYVTWRLGRMADSFDRKGFFASYTLANVMDGLLCNPSSSRILTLKSLLRYGVSVNLTMSPSWYQNQPIADIGTVWQNYLFELFCEQRGFDLDNSSITSPYTDLKDAGRTADPMSTFREGNWHVISTCLEEGGADPDFAVLMMEDFSQERNIPANYLELLRCFAEVLPPSSPPEHPFDYHLIQDILQTRAEARQKEQNAAAALGLIKMHEQGVVYSSADRETASIGTPPPSRPQQPATYIRSLQARYKTLKHRLSLALDELDPAQNQLPKHILAFRISLEDIINHLRPPSQAHLIDLLQTAHLLRNPPPSFRDRITNLPMRTRTALQRAARVLLLLVEVVMEIMPRPRIVRAGDLSIAKNSTTRMVSRYIYILIGTSA